MDIQKTYCTNNSRYKSGQTIKPVGIVLHSIGCPQPDARVLYKYWQNNGSPYVTHYVLDDVRILHTMPDNRKCWHVGTPGNNKWIGIEMCEPKQIKYTGGSTFTVSDRAAARAYCKKTYANAVQLLAKLCKQYGWCPHKAILTHGEITTKGLSKTDHMDPEHLWNGLGLDYSLKKLRADVAAAMGGSVKPESNANAAPSASYLVRITASVLNVRKGPGIDFDIATNVMINEVYTIVEEKDGWGKLKSGAGWINLSYTKRV